MKQTFLPAALALAASLSAAAQTNQTSDFITDNEEGLIETVANIEKKTDKFNLFLNMHGDFAANWRGNDFQEGKFEMKQLRIEMKGNINSWLSYRYRQRLNKGDSPDGYFDNLLQSIDIAGIGVKLDKWQLFLGKQCASYGGIEFDLNPIEIYQYSEIIDNMYNFMTGVNVAYNFTDRQQLQFQVLDALTMSSNEMYGPKWTKAKMPLVYTLNWNGNFSDVYKTRWSASVMNETMGEQMYYFVLGNDFNITDKIGAYFDWHYSREGVDRKGIMTRILNPAGFTSKESDVEYMSFVLHLNYRFLPKWNVFVKGMYETAGLYDGIVSVQPDNSSRELISKGLYRSSWGYIGGVEFYPLKDRNLHFFCTYVGERFNFTDKAKAFGNTDYNTNRLSVGFIWQMPIF